MWPPHHYRDWLWALCVFISVNIPSHLASHSEGPTAPSDYINVRLRDGDERNTTGRVEVSLGNSTEWGTVCDDLWSDNNAQVVCRQLGFFWGTSHTNSPFGQGSGPIFLDNVQCTGSEPSLAKCIHNGWGNNNCRHYEDAGVSCYNSSVRLNSRGRTDAGTVEIRLADGWVQVCDDEWDYEDAKVLCREMNLTDAMPLKKSKLGKISIDSAPVKALTEFKCKGTESSLLNCTHSVINKRCGRMNQASAICYSVPRNQVNMSVAVDLVNGSSNWGEVSIRKHGIWGQVCATGTDWNDNAAKVICRQKNFKNGKAFGTVNETLKPIWVTQLNCTGSETSIEQCITDVDSWGQPVQSCRAAFALCYNDDIQFSLADGGSYFGRVEITYDGVTGTVCDHSWSMSDARVLCKSLGFADGEPISMSFYGKGKGPVMMSGLGCYGQETSILECRNQGWMQYDNSECANHTRDASVVCYKNVRLSRGDHSHGVVQVMDNFWSVLCGEGFDKQDAKVICKQLGYNNGRALPPGSFGTFYGRYTWPNLNCTGSEGDISQCSYEKFRACQRDNYLGYAAVSCYNGTLTTASELKLDDGSGSPNPSSGRVVVNQYGIWGRICPSSWDDKDADVVCRYLNFTGGIALQETQPGSGPFFLGQVDCKGTEPSLFNCSIQGDECDSQYSGAAGVLCYRNRKPALQLVGGVHNYGRLEIVIDDERGTICDHGWSRYDATVACKALNFRDGEFRRGMPGQDTPKFLTSMNCFGGEDSLFMCKNPGWKRGIPEECQQPNTNAGVFCYNNVRISGGENHDNATTGQVEMYHDNKWVSVCADMFDSNDARVVCRELGFPNSKALIPGAFGSRYYVESIIELNCTGTEASINMCNFTMGTCEDRAYNYASVLCSKYPVDENGIKITVDGEFPATVLVEKDGINGTICAKNWTEQDAMVACRQMGYKGGVPFGPRYYSSRTPIWLSDINCLGNESLLSQCPYNDSGAQQSCRSNRLAARVFCYEEKGFELRIVGDNEYSGRVEMSYNGVWGTICDSFLTHDDARVICRQKGFVDGVAQPHETYEPGTGPSWLYYVRCEGTENSVWECGSSGWNVTHASCRTHKYDAGVYCTGKVRLEPNITFGAVEVWKDERYVLVCADDFDDIDAQVTCKSLGFQNGISLCCSVFGEMDKYPINISSVHCTGQESSLLECDHTYHISDACPSGKYASVACSNSAISGAYELRLSDGNMGEVQVRHLDVWGTICTDGFTDKNAQVLCRELGFRNGFSYYNYDHTYKSGELLPWLSHLNCTGTEGYLARCGNIRWGDVRDCSETTRAAVYCADNPEVNVRLKDGLMNQTGRVEISINGEYGTICGRRFTDDDAVVVCKMLKYSSGRALKPGSHGSGTGPIWINHIDCQGYEQSIFHCPISFNIKGESLAVSKFLRRPLITMANMGCHDHHIDAAVQCYDKVRLVDSDEVSYGRLQLAVNNTFYNVCDTNFTDTYATMVCKQLGYQFGRQQCCSALGPVVKENISISNIRCSPRDKKIDDCKFDFGKSCPSNSYVSVYCSDKVIIKQGIQVKIADSIYHGALEAKVYDFWGPICSTDWDDQDANVTCHQLGFLGGVAYKGSTTLKTPMALGRFDCQGTEERLEDCPHSLMSEDLGCSYPINGLFTRPTAGVLCYNSKEGVKFAIQGTRTSGSVILKYNGEWGRVCSRAWSDRSAGVVCRSLGFVDGKVMTGPSEKGPGHVWMDFVSCEGTEDSLFQCKLHWDPHDATCYDAMVMCLDSVRLEKGDVSHGIVQVYDNQQWGLVCNNNWNRKENILVTCRQLGYTNGISICCGAYGYLYSKSVRDNVMCTGTEKSLLKCLYDTPYGSCTVDYAAVACFNGSLPSSTEYSLELGGRGNVSGTVEITFLNITGRICADEWDDNDATVVCRQLGYGKGVAYQHKSLFGKGMPIWATDVACTGKEYKLSDCPAFSLGKVEQCKTRMEAGVLCYSDTLGVNYRIIGNESFGRVEVSVHNKWGTLCDRFWDKADASAFCRHLGFAAGFPWKMDKFQTKSGPVYEMNQHCTGDENSLSDCPHEGWKQSPEGSNCASHERDAFVHCYNTVKLESGIGSSAKHGPLLYYHDKDWRFVCDKNFDDVTAKKACQELGFVDGKAICCSAYGKHYQDMMSNFSLTCTGNEASIAQCLVPSDCGENDTYASVICLDEKDMENNHTQSGAIGKKDVAIEEEDKEHRVAQGNLIVKQFGVEGRVASRFWDDVDADVFCRSKGYKSGFSSKIARARYKGDEPYLIGDFNCTGKESSLLECPFHMRLRMGNNTEEHMAGVVCYNEDGISYRLNGTSRNQGRVEISFNGLWGTVCDASWDNKEAAVFCRMQGFSDGYAVGGAHYGEGEGPIWVSHLLCNGTEDQLHLCAHQGFSDTAEFVEKRWRKCGSHKDDASVFCLEHVKLSLGLNASMGAVQIYHNNLWNYVCDETFDDTDAEVICVTLGFKYGKALLGSAFGPMRTVIGVTNVNCLGTEYNFRDCAHTYSTSCSSGRYASVYCSNETINTRSEFDIRLLQDNPDDPSHGELNVRRKGLWGGVCMRGFDKVEADMVCKKLNFAGGVPYLIKKGTSSYPIFMSDLQCSGQESSLDKCRFTKGDRGCDYNEDKAGVLCYKKNGIQYRLVGDDGSQGRVEIGYDGEWGGVCDFLWDSNDANVLCRSLNFRSGLEIAGGRYGHSTGPVWFSRVSCRGSESDLLTCDHSGFNVSSESESTYERLCRRRSHDASARCFNTDIGVTKVRLANGGPNSGRVEVFLTGPNQWGTICDDYFDDRDATVICREQGFASGKGFKAAHYGRGSGPIWIDNLNCKGNETRLVDCEHNGFNIENCNHGEDAGVECIAETSGGNVTPRPAQVVTVPGQGGLATKRPEGPGVRTGEKSSEEYPEEYDNTAVAVTVPIIVILVVVVAILAAFVLCRRHSSSEMKKVLVDNENMESGAQASASTTAAEGGRVIFSKLKAHFTKPKATTNGGNDSADPKGISNPNYDNMSDMHVDNTLSDSQI